MKNIAHIFLSLLAVALLMPACEDDATLTTLKSVSFPSSPAILSSTTSIALTQDQDAENVIQFTWPEVDFYDGARVTYSAQFDTPEDTIGTSAWAKAKSVTLGLNNASGSITGLDLNTIATDLGLKANAAAQLAVRIKATVDRDVYSKPTTITVTPYKLQSDMPSIWIAGDFQGWNITEAPYIASVNDNGIYEGYINIPAGGTNQYKMYAQADWSPTSYGDGGSGALIVANYAGGNMTAPSNGYYEISANLNTMTWTQTLTTWGIIGDASPGGWSTDTQMTYDADAQVWKVTADMLATGSFKFRANGAWTIDFGIDADGNLKYADSPVFGYTAGLNNLTVPSNGNYTITLDLHKAGEYSYTIIKN